MRHVLLVALGVAIGLAGGFLLLRGNTESRVPLDARDAGAKTGRPAPALGNATGEARAAKDVAALKTETARLEAENERLRSRVATLERASSDDPPAIDPSVPPLRVPFGPWRALPLVRKTDWKKAGSAAYDLVKARRGRYSGNADAEAQAIARRSRLTLGQELSPLRDADGSLTRHPIVLLNLMAAHLEAAGRPLSDEQTAEVVELGERYVKDFATFKAGWTSGLNTELTLGRNRLQQRLVDAVVDTVLTDEQRGVLFEPAVRGLVYYDVYQPGARDWTKPSASTYWWDDRGAATDHLRQFLKIEWGVTVDIVGGLEALIGVWLDAIIARGVQGKSATTVTIKNAFASAAVQVEYTKRILDLLPADSPLRKRILASDRFVLIPNLSH